MSLVVETSKQRIIKQRVDRLIGDSDPELKGLILANELYSGKQKEEQVGDAIKTIYQSICELEDDLAEREWTTWDADGKPIKCSFDDILKNRGIHNNNVPTSNSIN